MSTLSTLQVALVIAKRRTGGDDKNVILNPREQMDLAQEIVDLQSDPPSALVAAVGGFFAALIASPVVAGLILLSQWTWGAVMR